MMNPQQLRIKLGNTLILISLCVIRHKTFIWSLMHSSSKFLMHIPWLIINSILTRVSAWRVLNEQGCLS